jgi:predicted metal-dependent hydrolase
MSPESVNVTAGLGGFLAFFLLALALYLLMRNMNARLRRMAYREEQEGLDGERRPADDPPDSSDPEGGPQPGPDLR